MTVEASAYSNVIETVEELEAVYGQPSQASIIKEIDRVIPAYAAFIEASPFVGLATSGPEGLDCSPRGDQPGFVRIHDERTLMMPDRRGNNRIDSLRNIVVDGRVGLLFFVPGSGTTLRVNGRARVSVDAELCASFAVSGKAPRSVIVVTVDSIYFQCARAIHRSRLWDPESWIDPADLPTPGAILGELSRGEFDGNKYDAEWPERAAKTMW
ncbi:pyridoxamine 5'-phosphate oxidase family protein [Chelativorans sp. YIM 93263]|uniref:pyridoxamine 5'-phosphate oxidase family protein n=1 Tax=Chelativorans sp. YIM 93263 TaxID=2906648 RepID=UPI002378AAB8|nr:pyridoxamine 5'-phosphate oxidase family protein [Chelativorans sp. YIM 93263]